MSLPACIVTILVVYPAFLLGGIALYRYAQKTKPRPFPEGNPRNKFVRPWRIAVHVVLLPLGAVLALAALGMLDPLFFLIRDKF
jgi:hypothetical protein